MQEINITSKGDYMIEIPDEVLEGVAGLIRMVCTKDNKYCYYANKNIGGLNYKIAIKLNEIDEEKEAKYITITLRRED